MHYGVDFTVVNNNLVKEKDVYWVNVTLFLVGNIPYEASDEQLKEIFSQAGPVLSFR